MKLRERSFFIMVIAVLNVAINVFISLVVPNRLSHEAYADWRIFILYIGFSGVMHLGLLDGLLLDYLRNNSSYARSRFLNNFITINALLLIVSATLSIVVFSVAESKFFWIPLILQFYIQNLLLVSQTYIQSQRKFITNSFLTFLPNLIFVALILILEIDSVDTLIHSFIFSFVTTILLSIVIILRTIPFDFSVELKEILDYESIRKIEKIGLIILLSGLLMLALRSFDRIVIYNYYSKSDFAFYAFANSLIVIFVMIFSSLNNMLLKQFFDISKNRRLMLEQNIYSISILIGACIIFSTFFMEDIIELIVPKYAGAINYFNILSLTIIPTLIISLLQFNYFKIEGKEFLFFKISSIYLIVAILVSFLLAYSESPLILHAYLKAVILWAWFITNEFIVSKYLNYKRAYLVKNYIALALVIFLHLISITIWN